MNKDLIGFENLAYVGDKAKTASIKLKNILGKPKKSKHSKARELRFRAKQRKK